MSAFGLGYRPDEPDARDRLHAISTVGLSSDVPSSASLEPHVLDVLDQGALGSCVLNALFQGVRVRARAKGEDYREIASRLFGYWHARNQHGDSKVDSGTMIRTAIKVTNKLGRPPESAWPYLVGDLHEPNPRFTRKPPPFVMMQAADKRRQKFHRLASYGAERWDEVKRSIAAGLPVAFGTDVGQSILSFDGSGTLDVPTDTIIGGHAMLLVGYDGDEAIGVNSWGTGWGSRGFFRMSRAYVEWWRTRDLWALDLP